MDVARGLAYRGFENATFSTIGEIARRRGYQHLFTYQIDVSCWLLFRLANGASPSRLLKNLLRSPWKDVFNSLRSFATDLYKYGYHSFDVLKSVIS
jgi:hypothetical protein